MALFPIIGPQFGGRRVRDQVELPKPARLTLRGMSTRDLKVAQAILSEEIRIAFGSLKASPPGVRSTGKTLAALTRQRASSPLESEIDAMKAQLSRIGGELTRRNLRDLKAGRTHWTRPRRTRRGLCVSLAEAARVI